MAGVTPHPVFRAAVVTVFLTGIFAAATLRAAPSTATANATQQQHIRQIEDHLVSPAWLEGQQPETTSLKTKMRELGVPAVSIAYIHQGRLAWTDAVGVKWLGGPAIDTETVFQAASISKPLTAVAVMRLSQSGRLDLDRAVNTYLRSWQLPNSASFPAASVTLRRLLSHTAGLSVHGFDGYPAGTVLPTVPQILNGTAPANSPPVRLEMGPGTRWSYSGGGYVVIQQLLSDATGESFPELLERLVLRPADMQRSSFDQPIAARLQDNAALPYDARGTKIGTHTYPEQAAAGLWTTPSDLARFALRIQQSLAGQSGGLLRAEVARDMLTPVEPSSWALGFRVGGPPGHRYFMHGGSNAGFRSLLVAFESGDGIAVMTSGDSGLGITSAVVRTAAVEYHWPALQPNHYVRKGIDARALERFAGIYRLAPDATATVRKAERGLQVQIADDEPLLFEADGKQHFFNLSTGAEATFLEDAQQHVTGVRIETLLATYDGVRDDPPPDAPSALKGLVGEYGADDSPFLIYEQEGQLYADGHGVHHAALHPLPPVLFSIDSKGIECHCTTVAFSVDPGGHATAATIGAEHLERSETGAKHIRIIRAGLHTNLDALRRNALSASPPTEPAPQRAFELVDLTQVVPGIRLDIRYATTNNFMGVPLYDRAAAFMQRPAAEALGRVATSLSLRGYGLLVHDAYRPWSVTKLFWDATPESAHLFVADPAQGSRHNRGCAVDLTLYDLRSGLPIEMTGDYDEMSPRSYADFAGGTSRQRWFRDLLRSAMETQGFEVYPQEWWHFDYKDWNQYGIGTRTFAELRTKS